MYIVQHLLYVYLLLYYIVKKEHFYLENVFIFIKKNIFSVFNNNFRELGGKNIEQEVTIFSNQEIKFFNTIIHQNNHTVFFK